MQKDLRILILEDSEDDVFLIMREIKKGGYEPYYQRVETEEEFISAIKSRDWDIIIADYNLPNYDGLKALEFVKNIGMDIPFIIVSGLISEDNAIDAMIRGAHDYIRKDNLKRLLPAIKRELSEANERKAKKKVEMELVKSEEKFRKLSETTTAAILFYKGDKLVYVNPMAEKISGYTKEEMLSTKFSELIHPDFRELVVQRATARLRGEEVPGRYEFKIIRKDGEERWVEISAGTIELDGEITGIATIFDITERKLAEEELKKTEIELRKRLKELEEFYELTVGREKRIIQLKEENERLKKEIERYKSLLEENK